MELTAEIDSKQLHRIKKMVSAKVFAKAIKRAGSTSLRDMRSEASKRIRKRKRLKVKQVKRALHIRKPSGFELRNIRWSLDISGERTRLSDYPHRQIRRGVSVSVNKGKRTIISGAFVATLRSGHEGVFIRRGPRRLPIRELLGSRPVDALLHEGEAAGVAQRGADSFGKTAIRLLDIELSKK